MIAHPEIHIWGDSVARGILFNDLKKRYALSSIRYTALLEERLGIPVHNHAIMGMTAIDGLNSFSQCDFTPDALCAIEFGGNDCDLDWAYVAEHPEEPVQAKVPLPQYRQALAQWAKAVRARRMEPLFVTPVPLHAGRYFRWVTKALNADAVLKALHGDENSIYRWQERYALAMRDIAAQTQSRLLDMRDAFLAHADYPSLMCVDGIHPNEVGYQLIADTVLGAVGV